MIPTIAALVGGGTFLLYRLLPDLSDKKLLEAESRILETIRAPFKHEWTEFFSKAGMWQIHSVHFKAPEEDVPARAPGPGPRPSVILLHGHSGGCAHWECIFDRVAEISDFHVIDLPGWGRSPAVRELQQADNPDDVIDLHMEMLLGWIRTRQLNHVVLVGHSLGGMLASHFAARNPTVVRHVILADVAGLTPAMARENIGWTMMMRFLSPQMIARSLGRWGLLLFRATYGSFSTEDERYPEYYYQLAAATEYRGYSDRVFRHFIRFSSDFRRLWWTRPVLDLVLQLPMPVSVIWGEDDELFPVSQAHLVRRLRPDIDLYIVRHGGHNPAHTNAGAFAEALHRALTSHQWAVRSPLSMSSPSRWSIATTTSPRSRTTTEEDADGVRFTRAHRTHSAGNLLEPFRDGIPSLTVEGDHKASTPAASAASASTPFSCPKPDSSLRPAAAEMEEEGEEAVRANAGAGADNDDADEGRRSTLEATTGASPPAALNRLPRTLTPTRLETSSRGICLACGGHVTMYKSYWRCFCGAWSFGIPTDPRQRAEEGEKMEAFLHKLHVEGTFSAPDDPNIGPFLSVRSAVPKEVIRGPPHRKHAEKVRRRILQRQREEAAQKVREEFALGRAETGGTGSPIQAILSSPMEEVDAEGPGEEDGGEEKGEDEAAQAVDVESEEALANMVAGDPPTVHCPTPGTSWPVEGTIVYLG